LIWLTLSLKLFPSNYLWVTWDVYFKNVLLLRHYRWSSDQITQRHWNNKKNTCYTNKCKYGKIGHLLSLSLGQ